MTISLRPEDLRWEAFAPFHDYLLAISISQGTRSLETGKSQQVRTSIRVDRLGFFIVTCASDGSSRFATYASCSKSTREWILALWKSGLILLTIPVTLMAGHPIDLDSSFEGTRIWGRGSTDDKNGLIAYLHVL